MKKEFVRNPYNYDSDEVSHATGLKCEDESLTEQEHAEEADINYIADRFMKTGLAPQVLNLPTPGDFTGIFDFQTAMNTINVAKQEFMKLPAKTRARFENDPAKVLDFLNDETNRDEAVKLGLVAAPAATPQEINNGPDTGSQTQTAPQSKKGGTGTKPAPKTPDDTQGA